MSAFRGHPWCDKINLPVLNLNWARDCHRFVLDPNIKEAQEEDEMNALILCMALFTVPPEMPDFTQGWDIVHIEKMPEGILAVTALNSVEGAKWKAVLMLVYPTADGYIPIVIYLFDGYDAKRFCLHDKEYKEEPFPDERSERIVRNHLRNFLFRCPEV